VSLSDPSGLATISGTGKAILSQLAGQLRAAAAYLQSIAANPSGFAGNVASGASVVRSNPMGVASAYASGIRQSVGQTARDLYYGNDATQNQALGSSILFFGSLAVPGGEDAGAAAELSDSALVVRGGGLANQSAEKIAGKIGASRTPGVTGFSVQWTNTCTNIADVGQVGTFLPNQNISVTTVGAVRAAGGDVIPTPGIGFHATVTGLSGDQAAGLSWTQIRNP